MKDKPSIRHTGDGYTVTRPLFGYGQPERKTFPTHKEAADWLRSTIKTRGTVSAVISGRVR